MREYQTVLIPKKIDEESREDDEEFSPVSNDTKPLIFHSNIADKSKNVTQLFPPESKKRSGVMTRIGNKIASVFKV